MFKIIIHYIHGAKFVLDVIFYFLLFPVAFVIYGRKKIWLVSEVNFDARDNGYHFFKYINLKHREINSYYLIKKTNPMYSAVALVGKTLEPGTLKHWLIYIASKYKIFTYVHGCCPNYHIQLLMKHIHSPGKSIALKHGVFKNLHPNYFKKNAHLDMICCGAEPEYKFVDGNFGYDRHVAKYTGLARFDNLHNYVVENEVLIMPTWRRWLNNIQSLEEFKQTEYYKNWFGFLSDKRVTDMAEKYNLVFYYYVHPTLNRYLDIFKDVVPNVVFLNSNEGNNIQSHLKSAKLLITDYSSVFFDFAYMRKPALFYQFDEDKYYKLHYIKAYFDYRKNGFGPVLMNREDLINELQKIITADFVLKRCFLENVNNFFPLNDACNCERIYNAIINL